MQNDRNGRNSDLEEDSYRERSQIPSTQFLLFCRPDHKISRDLAQLRNDAEVFEAWERGETRNPRLTPPTVSNRLTRIE